MRTIQVKIYRYDELSDSAKDRAKDDYRSQHGYIGEEEALETLRKLAEHFDAKLDRYEIDFTGAYCPSYAQFDFHTPEMSRREIARRLKRLGSYNPETLKGLGDCVLTGDGHDEDAIDGFRIGFLKAKCSSLPALMDAALRSLLVSCIDQYQAFYEEDFGEHCDANDMEFYSDGKLLPHRLSKSKTPA